MGLIERAETRVADAIMPWAAAHATVWPSQMGVHDALLDQIKDLEATNRGAVDRAKEAENDADAASFQAAFWRARAIELGAAEDEFRKTHLGGQ